MFGVQEILILGAVLVVFFGAKRLPQLGKSLGQSLKSFKTGLEEDNVKDVEPLNKDGEKKDGA